MHHKDIVDELKSHEPVQQKEKHAQPTDPNLADSLEKSALEAETPEGCAVKSDSRDDEIESLCQEIEQLKDQLLRAAAELKNTQMRTEREINHAHQFALEKFAKALLPIVDNLERALENIPNHDTHLEGVRLTHQLFLSTLERFNIQAMDPINQPFNPEFEEAISTQSLDGVEKNTVIRVFEKGYLLNKRLLRPARVVIAT